MRAHALVTLLAFPAFSAASIDAPRLARLLGLGAHETSGVQPLSPLAARLLGTLRAGDGRSLAAIEWAGRSVTLTVGETLGDAELVAIEQRTLVFLRAGRLERLGTEPGAATPTREVHPVSRKTIEWGLAHPGEVMGSAQLVPAFVGGRAVGFRVYGVRAGSLVAQLGLEAGDVLTSVNGTKLNTVQAALSLVATLPTARRVEVHFERGGRALQKAFELEP